MSTDRQSIELVLLDQEREARSLVNRGCIAIALVPVLVAASVLLGTWLDSFTPIIAAALYAVCGGTLGSFWLAAGLLRGYRARRELRELMDTRIPEARLLE